MVMPAKVSKLLAALGRDCGGFLDAIRQPRPIRPGLYTYRTSPPGGTRRLHLRIDADGSGLLLVDATDAVHLNPTAALVAKLTLEGASLGQIAGHLRRVFRGIDANQLAREASAVHEAVRHMATTADLCPTCGLERVVQSPPFSTHPNAPYKADLALTYGCNNRCAHCYNPPARARMPSLDLAGWKRVLDRLVDVGIPHGIFTGGEPTLVRGLADLIAHAEALGLITGLNTNGRRMTDRGFAQSLADAGLCHVQVTLESPQPEVHDAMTGTRAFHETVRGIRNALASGLHTITNTTLTRKNAGQADALVGYLHDLGLRTFAVNGMIYSGAGRTAVDAISPGEMGPLLARLRDRAGELGMRMLWYTPTAYCELSPVELGLEPRRCNAGEYSVCIEPNGDVLPCQSYYHPVGNLLDDPWESIWNSPLFRSFRGRSDDPAKSGLPVECWDCPDLDLCGGGCRIERENAPRLQGCQERIVR